MVSAIRPMTAPLTITRERVTVLLGDGGLAWSKDREVRHVAPGLRAVPMLRVLRDEGDIADAHHTLLFLIRDDALALRDDEHLIRRVQVPLVARAAAEVHLGHAEVVAHVVADERLVIDVALEDRIRAPLATGRRDLLHPH